MVRSRACPPHQPHLVGVDQSSAVTRLDRATLELLEQVTVDHAAVVGDRGRVDLPLLRHEAQVLGRRLLERGAGLARVGGRSLAGVGEDLLEGLLGELPRVEALRARLRFVQAGPIRCIA